jgi:hypothetical protein
VVDKAAMAEMLTKLVCHAGRSGSGSAKGDANNVRCIGVLLVSKVDVPSKVDPKRQCNPQLDYLQKVTLKNLKPRI